jgi:two-component system, OmpR family, response regulator MprA
VLVSSTSNPLGKVLVVDDDPAIRTSLSRALSLEGYAVDTAEDGNAALSAVAASQPDVIVLDLMMPNIDGLSVCRVLRSEGNRVPILMLTARTETSDRVSGLDAGADDYLGKPFALEEMLARVRALMRRWKQVEGDRTGDILGIADLRIDCAARVVERAGREIDVSKTEFDLLELLVRNQGIVLDHSTIYDRIWGYDFGPESKNLAVYIGYIRRKIDTEGLQPLIHTVRGVGYTVRVSMVSAVDGESTDV